MNNDDQAFLFTADASAEMLANYGSKLVLSKTALSAGEVLENMADLCVELESALSGWVIIGKRAGFGEGGLLYWIGRNWADLEPFHDQYSSFNEFALGETGQEYSTWRMKIAVYRMFILNDIKDETVTKLGTEKFLNVPMGKLQKAIGTIRRGKMTEEFWDALLDPQVMDRHFHQILKGGGTTGGEGTVEGESESESDFVEKGGDPRVTVDMASGALSLWPGGDQVAISIGWLEVNPKSDMIQEIVDSIITAADIKRVG